MKKFCLESYLLICVSELDSEQQREAVVHLWEEEANCRKVEFRAENRNWPICVSLVGVRQIGRVILAALQDVLIYNRVKIKNNRRLNFTYVNKECILNRQVADKSL